MTRGKGGHGAISVVILNWARPWMLTDYILPWLERYACVDEIILSHGRRDTAFGYKSRHCRVVHRPDWEVNEEYGLARRWVAGSEASNEVILHMDDDLLIPEESVERLLTGWGERPEVIHGLHGRTLCPDFKYRTSLAQGDVVLIGTGSALCSRALAERCLSSEYAEIWDFVRRSDAPVLWNGEDIFQALVAFQHSGLLNRGYALPYIDFFKATHGPVAIHAWSGHIECRTRFLQYAIEKMGLRERVAPFIYGGKPRDYRPRGQKGSHRRPRALRWQPRRSVDFFLISRSCPYFIRSWVIKTQIARLRAMFNL